MDSVIYDWPKFPISNLPNYNIIRPMALSIRTTNVYAGQKRSAEEYIVNLKEGLKLCV